MKKSNYFSEGALINQMTLMTLSNHQCKQMRTPEGELHYFLDGLCGNDAILKCRFRSILHDTMGGKHRKMYVCSGCPFLFDLLMEVFDGFSTVVDNKIITDDVLSPEQEKKLSGSLFVEIPKLSGKMINPLSLVKILHNEKLFCSFYTFRDQTFIPRCDLIEYISFNKTFSDTCDQEPLKERSFVTAMTNWILDYY